MALPLCSGLGKALHLATPTRHLEPSAAVVAALLLLLPLLLLPPLLSLLSLLSLAPAIE